MNITLHTLAQTEQIGKLLASTLHQQFIPAILFFGPLGAGKTTLSKAFVTNLQDAETIEVSSPSFTICNIYSTIPPVYHFDLYRTSPQVPMDELAEAFDTDNVLTIVEWAEHMHPSDAPPDGISCEITLSETHRTLTLSSLGEKGSQFLQLIQCAIS